MGSSAGKLNSSTPGTAVQAHFPDTNLRGKRAIVTGANRGIGYWTARALALAGVEVVLACRDTESGKACESEISALIAAQTVPEGATRGSVEVAPLDLASFDSVREFCILQRSIGKPVHLLINNAGIMGVPYRRTEDGYESTWQVNHLSHFLLTNLLKPLLVAAAPSRVICVSSDAIRFSDCPIKLSNINDEAAYSSMRQYGRTKLANAIFARELNKRWSAEGVTAVSLHPGFVKTDLPRDNASLKMLYSLGGVMAKTPDQGASTTLVCCFAPAVEGGRFYSDCQLSPNSGPLLHTAQDETLWESSREWTKLDLSEAHVAKHSAALKTMVVTPAGKPMDAEAAAAVKQATEGSDNWVSPTGCVC